MTLCDRCVDPGMCCKDIRLSYNHPGITKLEVMAWLASVHCEEFNIGLPFIPDIRSLNPLFRVDHDVPLCPIEMTWTYQCINLTEDGRCGDYENRPQLCRDHKPGHHQPCIMNHYPCPVFVEE
jgi:Fe-S-cluster containining protein